MKHLIVSLTSLLPALGILASVSRPAGEDDKAAVTRVLNDYYSAFSTLDMQAFVPYYHEPCFIVAPQGVAGVPTHAALVATLTPSIEGLRTRGFARSKLIMLEVKRLSATTMLAGGVAVRYMTDSQELERVGVAYVLQKADNRWRIVVIVVHDADNRLRLE